LSAIVRLGRNFTTTFYMKASPWEWDERTWNGSYTLFYSIDTDDGITYSITEWIKSPSGSKRLGSSNLCYASLILSLLNKGPIYVVLTSDSEDASISFLHVRALCPVPPQFPQCCRAGWASS
jgi:hypothetical protein